MAAMAAAAIGAAGAVGSALLAPDAPKARPYEQMHAGMVAQNPDQNSFWGGSQTIRNDMGTDSAKDDTYTINQTMSPEMEALANELQARVGASRGTYSSGGMPEHLQKRYAQTAWESQLNPQNRAQLAQAERMDYQNMAKSSGSYAGRGMGGNRLEGAGAFNPSEGFTDTGRQNMTQHMPNWRNGEGRLANYRPSMPTFERPEFGFGSDGSAVTVDENAGGVNGINIDNPEDYTNAEALNFLRDNGLLAEGNISTDDAVWLQKMFAGGEGPAAGSAKAITATNDGAWIGKGGLNAKNQQRIHEMQDLWQSYAYPNMGNQSKSEPSSDKYNPDALNRLIREIGNMGDLT